jgi:hypothetical protein
VKRVKIEWKKDGNVYLSTATFELERAQYLVARANEFFTAATHYIKEDINGQED